MFNKQQKALQKCQQISEIFTRHICNTENSGKKNRDNSLSQHFKQVQKNLLQSEMQSSDNQLSHSADYRNMKHISEHQNDQNSMNKANLSLRGSAFKSQIACDSKAIAFDLLKRIELLEQKLDILESRQVQGPRRKKKLRRKAKQIPRIYKCQFSNCGKEYGSQASLKNHKKIKHGIRLIRRSKQTRKVAQSISDKQQ